MDAFDDSIMSELIHLNPDEPGWITELISVFLADGRSRIQMIEEGMDDDWEGCLVSLHALKGASLNVGALNLARATQALSEATGSIRAARFTDLVVQFDACVRASHGLAEIARNK